MPHAPENVSMQEFLTSAQDKISEEWFRLHPECLEVEECDRRCEDCIVINSGITPDRWPLNPELLTDAEVQEIACNNCLGITTCDQCGHR